MARLIITGQKRERKPEIEKQLSIAKSKAKKKIAERKKREIALKRRNEIDKKIADYKIKRIDTCYFGDYYYTEEGKKKIAEEIEYLDNHIYAEGKEFEHDYIFAVLIRGVNSLIFVMDDSQPNGIYVAREMGVNEDLQTHTRQEAEEWLKTDIRDELIGDQSIKQKLIKAVLTRREFTEKLLKLKREVVGNREYVYTAIAIADPIITQEYIDTPKPMREKISNFYLILEDNNETKRDLAVSYALKHDLEPYKIRAYHSFNGKNISVSVIEIKKAIMRIIEKKIDKRIEANDHFGAYNLLVKHCDHEDWGANCKGKAVVVASMLYHNGLVEDAIDAGARFCSDTVIQYDMIDIFVELGIPEDEAHDLQYDIEYRKFMFDLRSGKLWAMPPRLYDRPYKSKKFLDSVKGGGDGSIKRKKSRIKVNRNIEEIL